ncbi:MAG: hypothetical protein EXR73_08895 [Myxococcales bacterium]|nr:hypothetical protein [Myxococcales bacterium]
MRTRLQSASDAERAQLLGTLVASLRGADPLARAQQLNELFQANGWFGDKPGAPLDESVWRLAGDTLRELPEGAEHDSLLVTLGQQLARVRGTNALASLVSLSTLTLADESARFAGRSPDPDPAVLALMRQQLVDGATAGTLDQNAALYGAFGLGGSDASADDQRALMRLATDGCMPKVRVSGYFALATTPPSVEIDTFLVRNATSGAHVWKDRVMAWQVLRRRGREELLPASVVQELLSMWERSGATDLEQLLDD